MSGSRDEQQPAPRQPADTVSVLTYRTGPQDANLAGNVQGGWIMKLCDDAAVIPRPATSAGASSPPRWTA